MDKIKLLYIHGLGSDKNSRKFIDLKAYFKDAFEYYCMEWKNEDNIDQMLVDIEALFNDDQTLIVVGDSTGGNFAYQLKESRKKAGNETVLVLLNPLLNFSLRITSFVFPENIKQYLDNILKPEEAFILLGQYDEVLDHSYLDGYKGNKTVLFSVEDSHRIPKFQEYLPTIEMYIQTLLRNSVEE